LGLDYYGPLKK